MQVKYMEKIKEFFNIATAYYRLLSENENLKNEIELLKFKSNEVKAEKVIEEIIDRGIKWFDYESMNLSEKYQYYLEIKDVLNNKALKNEIDHYLSDLINEIAMSAKSYDEVMALRMSINGIKVLFERLEDIYDPTVKRSKDDLNSAI
jgi:hypothetical protein